jgi:hypothetical protein
MSSISAGTSAGTALVQTGDTTGALVIKTGGSATTAATFNADQTTTFAGAVTAPSFSGTSSTATNLAGGSNGTIPYQSAAGTTQMLAVGTAGQVLTSNGVGAPSWTSPSSGGFTAKTSNYTAASGDNILANTSAGSWTLTLPSTPATGSAVQVMDSIGTFGAYPLTVARNGSTIMSASEDMTLDVNGAATTFVYNGSTWRVI